MPEISRTDFLIFLIIFSVPLVIYEVRRQSRIEKSLGIQEDIDLNFLCGIVDESHKLLCQYPVTRSWRLGGGTRPCHNLVTYHAVIPHTKGAKENFQTCKNVCRSHANLIRRKRDYRHEGTQLQIIDPNIKETPLQLWYVNSSPLTWTGWIQGCIALYFILKYVFFLATGQ